MATASLHAYVCMIQWLTCLALFIWGLRDDTPWEPLWWVALLAILGMPIVNEIFLNLKYCLCKSRILKPDADTINLKDCLPIVYSSGYNIHAFGIEKCHPFDSEKYRRVHDDLNSSGLFNIAVSQPIHEPNVPTREFLQHVMSPWYLFLLNYAIKVSACIELPLVFLPGWFLRMRVLDPMMRACRGSVDAACIAR